MTTKIKEPEVDRSGIRFASPVSGQEFYIPSLAKTVENGELINRFAALIGDAEILKTACEDWQRHREAKPAIEDLVSHGVKTQTMRISLLRHEADVREIAGDCLAALAGDQRVATSGHSLASRDRQTELLDGFVAQGYTDVSAFKPAVRKHASVLAIKAMEDIARNAATDYSMAATPHRSTAPWCRQKAGELCDEIAGGSLAAAVYREPTGEPGVFDDRAEREAKRTRTFSKLGAAK